MRYDDWTVTLVRKPYLEDRVWNHENEASAMRRVWHLSSLHSCSYTIVHSMNLVIVNASAYYRPREART